MKLSFTREQSINPAAVIKISLADLMPVCLEWSQDIWPVIPEGADNLTFGLQFN
jgi:hypothetical protein